VAGQLCRLTNLLVSRVAQSVWLRAGRPGDRGSIPGRGERNFPLASVSRPTLGPPVQLVPGVLSPELKNGRGVTLTTHPHLVPRSRMSRSYTFSSPKQLFGVWCESSSFLTSLLKKYIIIIIIISSSSSSITPCI
jgi:hypothetical protein